MISLFTRLMLSVYTLAVRLGILRTRWGQAAFMRAYTLYKTHYEAREATALLAHIPPKTCVIDVGANTGFFTRIFAQHLLDGEIFAIEPEANNCRLLRDMLQHNQLASRVTVIEGVADTQAGQQPLTLDPFHPANHRIAVGNGDVLVKSITLDSLLQQVRYPVSLVKIDVQGAELRVLQGAETLLRTYHPALYVEVSDVALGEFGTTTEALLGFIHAAGYNLYHQQKRVSLDEARVIVSTAGYTDFLCLYDGSEASKTSL